MNESDAASIVLGEWLLEVEAHPILSLLIAALLVSLLCFSTIAPAVAGLRRSNSLPFGLASDGLFLGVAGILMIACRAPALAVPKSLNPDEGQLLAQAMRFYHVSPVPWVAVETTTSGPLNTFALLIPMLFGSAPSWFMARSVGVACWLVALGLSYFTMRQLFGAVVGRLALLPAILFVAAASNSNFTHYSTEHIPILLLSLALYLGVSQISRNVGGWRLVLAGIALGAVPFAKLQAVPIGLGMGLLLLAGIFLRFEDFKVRAHAMGQMMAGSLVVPVLMLSWVASADGLADFWKFYIVNGLLYGAEYDSPRTLAKVLLAGHFPAFLCSSLALMAIGFFGGLRSKPEKYNVLLVAGALALFVAAMYAVIRPGTFFGHYALLLVLPAGWLSASLLGWLQLSEDSDRPLRLAIAASMLSIVWFAVPLLVEKVTLYGEFASLLERPNRPAVALLRSLAKPKDRLTIWGWMPQYYVESGLVPATRHAIGHFVIRAEAPWDRYRETFLEDLDKESPLFLLEAVGPGNFRFKDRESQGIAAFEDVARRVSATYSKVVDRTDFALHLRSDAAIGLEEFPGHSVIDIEGDWALGARSIHRQSRDQPGQPDAFYGSWNGGDAKTGELRITLHDAPTAPRAIVIPVLVGPKTKTSSLALYFGESSDGQPAADAMSCNLERQRWGRWFACVLPLLDRSDTLYVIKARDDGEGWGEWFSIGTPLLILPPEDLSDHS